MSGSDETTATRPEPMPQLQGRPSARFGPDGPSTLIQNVHLTTDRVDIHPPSLNALERMAAQSPETARDLIEASKFTVKQNTKRFLGGTISAAVVCVALLGFSAYVIVNAGFWAGIVFFFAAVAVSGVMVAALTGKVQDISWVVRMMPGGKPAQPAKPQKPSDGEG